MWRPLSKDRSPDHRLRLDSRATLTVLISLSDDKASADLDTEQEIIPLFGYGGINNMHRQDVFTLTKCVVLYIMETKDSPHIYRF